MGSLIRKILGEPEEHSSGDYSTVDFRTDGVSTAASGLDRSVRVATVSTQQHLLQVKDSLCAGNIVIATVKEPAGGLTVNRVVDEFKNVVQEVDGDIVRQGRRNFILTPKGINVDRDPIGN